MSHVSPTIRQRIGCWANERWRTEVALRWRSAIGNARFQWMNLCNRQETISIDPVTGGRRCHWKDSSPLTVARIYPQVGGRLLQRCLEEWPVHFTSSSSASVIAEPEVSVVIGVRGTGRLPQFRACLASLQAQRGVRVEIIVVEQCWNQLFAELIPPDVRYVHQRTTHPDMPYNRSWAFNRGVVEARGEVVVLFDADMLAPADMCRSIITRIRQGLDAIRLPRLLFYLDQPESTIVWNEHRFDHIRLVSRIVQNNPTPMAVTRAAYHNIGGHDESFFGWGGEDNEFLDRCRTLRIGEGGYLPIIHLWHEEAPNRSGDRNGRHLQCQLTIPTQDRIRNMSAVPFGQDQPTTPWLPKTN